MRIAQICTCFAPGGIQRHVLDLTHWLRNHGHYVTLAGSPGSWSESARDAHYLPLDVLGVGAGGRSIPRRCLQALRSAAAFRAFLRANQIDIVHAHDSAPAIVAGLATMGLRIPLVVSFHGAEPERVPGFGRVVNFAADRVITPSFNSARELAESGRVHPSRIDVIGLGIRSRPRAEAAQTARLRAQLLGPDGETLVVTIARLAHQKGMDILVDVARRALGINPRIRFVVVGGGPQDQEVRAWAAAAGVSDMVTFAGHSDTPEAYLAASDIFMLTSRWESLPLTIVEAFREGLPVIATDTGGIRELVDDSVGAVVQVGDTAGLAREVLKLAGDLQARRQLSVNALARSADDRFSPERVHARFERLYASMLHETGAS